MIRKINKLLDHTIRPGLASHQGGVDVIDYDNDIVYVKLSGGCQGCASANDTLKSGIEKTIKENFPEIKEVIDITDHNSGQNPYYK